MLQEFFIKTAEHLIFVGALAGQIEPFVTVQNYAGSKIPVRLLNLDDFAQGMKRLEYRLLKKARHVSPRLGVEGFLPMDNFPKKYRIEHPWR